MLLNEICSSLSESDYQLLQKDLLNMDTALPSLIVIARFYQLPAEPDQLMNQSGKPGEILSNTEFLIAVKSLTKQLSLFLADIKNTYFPLSLSPAMVANSQFFDEIESRIGIRIEQRVRGRPRNAKK